MRDFKGALLEHKINYGIMITTGKISDRAVKRAQETNLDDTNQLKLELIDQNILIECMEYRGDLLHGFGLHKTDDLKWYYLNPGMLRKAISNY